MRQEDEAGGPQDTGKAQEPEGSAEKAGSKKDKYQKAQAKAEHAGEKLGKAREKLDKTEAKRAAKKPPGLAKKAVRGVRTEAWFYVHNKIHEVEHENVGVEGAHKSELAAEAGTRKLTRYAKRRWQEHPARKVAKWERKDIKARANVDFQKMASEHPELTSNPLSRVQQKWKLKRRYSKEAKAAAKQGAKAAKKTAAASETATRRAAQKPPGLAKKAVRGARTEAWFYLHNKIHEVEHENVGVEGAHKSELVAEAGARKLTRYAKRRYREHPARKVAKWERKDIKARANVDFQKMASEHPELASNPLSRVQQKWKLKRRYSKEAKAAAKQGAKAAKKTAAASGTATRRAAQFVTRHPVAVLVLLLLLLLCFLVSAVSSIFPTLGSGLANALSGTSYASEDTDLLGVDEDYTALENELAQTVANIESTHPGYDEYRYSVDEIGHNPYELASYLSAKYHVYFREQVQDELREIFEAQYELTLTEKVEIRYRTETSTDPETGETTTEEVPYEYYILNVTLTNKTLPAVILPRLNEQQREIYIVMQQLKGNKPYLWEGIYNGGEDTGPSYEIPGEALDDPAFAALMEEATKYIGWPYVWGGSSPSTSFDCSGFVCWVYTASGVHNLPRTTAQGIYNQCAIISPSEAKPGDIIFFTGTYDSPGPVSHVGIYVGDGMMLHCGSPIQYANINSSYWQTHFYAFGRL